MRRGITAVLALSGLLLTGVAPLVDAPAQAQTASADPVEAGPSERTGRLRGGTRFETAVQISKHAFPEGAPVVHLARGDVYVDALAGGVLTAGPILLVPTSGAAPKVVLDEVARLRATHVIALGGTAAVSDQMLRDVARGRTTARLRGPDRWATAAAISRHLFPKGARTAYVARTNAEALAFGNAKDGPVLLVPPSGRELPASVHDEIRRLDVDHLVIALNDPVLQQNLDRLTRERPDGTFEARVTWPGNEGVEGLAGRIAVNHFGQVEAPVAYLARIDDPVDALAGGLLLDGPVLLTPPCDVHPEVAAELETFDPARIIALGGPGAICDEALVGYGAIARDPFPAAGLDDVRTLSREVSAGGPGSSINVWWSRDGSTMLREERWLEGTERRLAHIVEDITTGEVRILDTTQGDSFVIGISNDGSRFWTNHFTPERAVREHPTNGGPSRRVLADPIDHAFGATAGFEWGEEQGTIVVHDLERGTSWTYLGDEEYFEDGAGRGNWKLWDPHGHWVITGTHGHAVRTFGVLSAVHADGTVEELFGRESNGCGDLVRHRVEDATSDLSRLLVVRSGKVPAGGTCNGAIPLELLLIDREAGTTVQLPTYQPDALGYAHQGGHHLTGDGRTVVFASLVSLPEFNDGTWPMGRHSLMFDRWDDGARFAGAPPVDGGRLAVFLADADELLAGKGTWRELGWGRAKPDLHLRRAGHTADQLAWEVTGPTDRWPRYIWVEDELPAPIVAIPR